MADGAAFLAMLPQFDQIELATIEAHLATAALTVTSEWGADTDPAQIYLAAHNMSMLGLGPERAAASLVGIKSISSGGMSITKEDRGRMGDYALTSFGRAYWPMLQGNRGGFLITGTGYVPDGVGGYYPPENHAD